MTLRRVDALARRRNSVGNMEAKIPEAINFATQLKEALGHLSLEELEQLTQEEKDAILNSMAFRKAAVNCSAVLEMEVLLGHISRRTKYCNQIETKIKQN